MLVGLRKRFKEAAQFALSQCDQAVDVERIVTTVLDSVSKALADGHRVELRGFGAFSVKVRPSRMGRNPRTGEPVSVGQKRAPFFRTGKELRERLNGGTPD